MLKTFIMKFLRLFAMALFNSFSEIEKIFLGEYKDNSVIFDDFLYSWICL